MFYTSLVNRSYWFLNDTLHKGVEGQIAQVTTANMEALQDTQFRPERHGDLIMRVGRIQFVQPEERAQNEIIRCYHEDFLPIHGEND